MESRQSLSVWLYVGVIAIFAIVVVFSLYKSKKENALRQVSDFETCAQAGFPVMESYPEQCRTSDGRTFVRKITEPVETTTPEFPESDEPTM